MTKIQKYILVDAEGNRTEKTSMSLAQIQTWIQGYISNVGDTICNEAGDKLGLPVNKAYPQFLGNIIILEKIKIY